MIYVPLFAVVATLAGGNIAPTDVGTSSIMDDLCGAMYQCEVAGETGDWMSRIGTTHDPLPTYFHTECLLCEWDVCHYSCFPDEQEQEQEEQDLLLAYSDLLQAFDSGDVARIIHEARTEGWPVVWEADRGALQLIGCDGQSVMASYTVDAHILTRAADPSSLARRSSDQPVTR